MVTDLPWETLGSEPGRSQAQDQVEPAKQTRSLWSGPWYQGGRYSDGPSTQRRSASTWGSPRCRGHRRSGGFLPSQGWVWQWGCCRGSVLARGVTTGRKSAFLPPSCRLCVCQPYLPCPQQPSYSFLKIDLKSIYVKKKQKTKTISGLHFQWLRVCASHAGGTALIPGWGSHMLCRRGKVSIVFDENKKIKII